MKRIDLIISATLSLALLSGCSDLAIEYAPEALQDLSDRENAVSLRAENVADDVVKVTLRKGEGFKTLGLYADATHPAKEEQIIQIKVGDESVVKDYAQAKGVDYKLLPKPFYKFLDKQTLNLHEGSTSTAMTQLRLFAINPLDNVLDEGRYLLPLSVSSLWSGSTSRNVYIDVTVRGGYSDPDGYELYTGDDMFTIFYLNTAVFDPRLANDFILENMRDRNYHRGLGNIVNLRQSSIHYDNRSGKVVLKLTNDLRYVLEHFTERVLPVQESGRKVCICIDGGAQGIGFCNLTDNQIDEFARSVKKVVDYYGLDGANLWDRNANYAVSEEKGFPKTNTSSYPKLIKRLRELLGPNKLLTVTDYEEPTEYFWDTEATGGIRVGEFIDYAWSGYCANDEPVQIVDPWHQELPSVSKLHPRKPFAGLNPRRYGVSNVTCYRKQDDSLFALEQYDKSEFTNSNISVFYDVRSILQDSYEGANIMDAFIRVWYGSYLQISPRRLTNYVFTPSHPTNYNKWGKDW